MIRALKKKMKIQLTTVACGGIVRTLELQL